MTLMGRLCENAEQKETAKGVPYVHFRLAVRSLRPSRNGPVLEESMMDLQMFNPGGKAQYMVKGRQLIVMGRLETYRKEGDKWDRLKVVVDDSIFTDNKPMDGAPANGEEPMDYEAYIAELQDANEELRLKLGRLQRDVANGPPPAPEKRPAVLNGAPAPAKKAAAAPKPSAKAQKRAETKRTAPAKGKRS